MFSLVENGGGRSGKKGMVVGKMNGRIPGNWKFAGG